MKILSPAGNFECLKMAVYNGADEVYLGINDFNARNIDSFTLQTLKPAVDFAHIYGVKVHLAINILFDNSELQKALDIIVEAYNMGVDAFIIQDLGLISLVNKLYPQVEIHASTQMGLHNLEGYEAVKQFNFKRIVLARETPLKEIARIDKAYPVEIEYFGQGALCVCFSGNCYLSSYLNNASGNRGKCKQLCRLPYTLQKDNKPIKNGYLLSAKDFNMLDRLGDLQKAGVDAIKIEGRARRPYYVATATSQYHNALNNQPVDQDKLKLAFNRQYTPGYFEGNGNIISNLQNHIGINVGKVEKVVGGKTFNEVYFSSNRELSSKSTFKVFENNQEKSTLTAYDLKALPNNTYRLTTTQNVKKGDNLNLIVDNKLETLALDYVYKRPIKINLTLQQNQPIKAIVHLDNNVIEVNGEVCQVANKQPITQQDLQINFDKSEYFTADLKITELQSVFMPKQQLNEFRRNVWQKVVEHLTQTTHSTLSKTKIANNYKVKSFEDFEIVHNQSQKFNSKNIIYSPDTYKLDDIKDFIAKCKTQNKVPYLDTPNFALQQDIEFLKDIINKTKISIVANNYYALTFDTDIIVGAGLNVYNNTTASVFDKPVICAEGDIASKIKFPYMTLRHCPMQSHLNATCAKCPYKDGYSYKMESGKVLHLHRKKLSTCTFYLTD